MATKKYIMRTKIDAYVNLLNSVFSCMDDQFSIAFGL